MDGLLNRDDSRDGEFYFRGRISVGGEYRLSRQHCNISPRVYIGVGDEAVRALSLWKVRWFAGELFRVHLRFVTEKGVSKQ